MNQVTQTPIPTNLGPSRASYQRAHALAHQLVDQVPTLPNAVEAHRSFALDSFEARLHFGAGLAAGRGVLEVAALTDTAVSREEKRDEQGHLIGVWIGMRTVVDGVPVSAWALTSEADAAELLQPDDPIETQPIPTVGASPSDVVVPAVIAVTPLSARTTTTVADPGDVARCVKCGCTEDAACEGGCYWVPNEDTVDLCSSCATPQQLAAMVFAPAPVSSTSDGDR